MGGLPLDGKRVCDFTWLVAGPTVTQMLAVMGAEVIKIESNVHTDLNRRMGPYLNGEAGDERTGNFPRVNLSKKSCTLDLTRPEAAELAKELVKVSDIVVSNFRNGLMEGYGLSYDVLRELKPDLVLAHSSGMGTTGPNRDYVCYNEEGYAFGGLGYLTGFQDKAPNMIVGDFADYLTGTLETFAILSAVHYHARTGKGQTVEIPMVEAVASHVPEAVLDYSMNRRVRERIGNHAEGMAPHNCFPCQGDDRWVAIAVTSDREWEALCDAIGRPEWVADEKFTDMRSREENQEELERLIAQWTRARTPDQVVAILQGAGVPAGSSLSIEELVNDPHLKARGFFVAPEHPVTGKRLLEGIPWKASASQPAFKHAPLLGQDNYYVFHDLLGMADEEFARLVDERIIH